MVVVWSAEEYGGDNGGDGVMVVVVVWSAEEHGGRMFPPDHHCLV
jgi:hypothetical protein